MQSRILTHIGFYHRDDTVNIDYGEFAQDLLLYDSVLINSVQLKEMISLTNDLGIDTVIELAESGAVKICVRCASIGMPEGGDSSTYKLIALHTKDQDEYLARCFGHIDKKVKAKRRKIERLKESIRACLIPESIDPFQQALAETRSDIISGQGYLQRIIRRRGQSEHKILLEVEDIISNIEEVEPNVFRIECTPLTKVGVSPEVCRKLVQKALFAASSTNQWVTESVHFDALSTFGSPDDLYESNKFDLVARRMNADVQEAQWHRVVDMAGINDVSAALKNGNVNFGKLINARNSDDALQFRAWLRTVEHISDDDLNSRLSSLRTAVGNQLGTTAAKTLRFVANLGLGAIPGYGTAIGAVTGVVDSFIVDRVFKRSGPVYFIKKVIPTFVRNDGK